MKLLPHPLMLVTRTLLPLHRLRHGNDCARSRMNRVLGHGLPRYRRPDRACGTRDKVPCVQAVVLRSRCGRLGRRGDVAVSVGFLAWGRREGLVQPVGGLCGGCRGRGWRWSQVQGDVGRSFGVVSLQQDLEVVVYEIVSSTRAI
jgi:hypothetical protein